MIIANSLPDGAGGTRAITVIPQVKTANPDEPAHILLAWECERRELSKRKLDP